MLALARTLLCALLILSARAGSAAELWAAEDGPARLQLRGSVREIVTASRGTRLEDFEAGAVSDPVGCSAVATFPDCAAFARLDESGVVQSLTRLRLDFDARLSESIDARITYDNEFLAGHLRTLGTSFLTGLAPKSFIGAEQLIASEKHVAWQHRLYRGYLHFEQGPLEVRVGRQRIAWGEARLWNPIDRLNAIGPLAIESDQSPGVDAIDLRWNFTGFDYAQLVYAPGRSDATSRYAARLHFVALDTDVSVLGGLFQDAPIAGVDLSRNVGGAAVRLEVIWTDPEHQVLRYGAARREEPDPFWQWVVSADYNVDIGTGLYVLVEHLYNGNALGFGRGRAGPLIELFEFAGPRPTAQSSDLFGTSQVISFAPHLTGAELAYDLAPEVRARLLGLVDWKGGSGLLFPGLVYSPARSFELSLGVQVGFGPRRSEFGSRTALGYALAEWFF